MAARLSRVQVANMAKPAVIKPSANNIAAKQGAFLRGNPLLIQRQSSMTVSARRVVKVEAKAAGKQQQLQVSG
jgi:hypothetical protein